MLSVPQRTPRRESRRVVHMIPGADAGSAAGARRYRSLATR